MACDAYPSLPRHFLGAPIMSTVTHEITGPITLVFILAGAALLWLRWARPKQYPPGPKGSPLLGNALQIPNSYMWLYFIKLQERFGTYRARFTAPIIQFWSLTLEIIGDVVYLSALGRPIVVLNSFSAVRDLLIMKAAIYSGRPRLVMGGEM